MSLLEDFNLMKVFFFILLSSLLLIIRCLVWGFSELGCHHSQFSLTIFEFLFGLISLILDVLYLLGQKRVLFLVVPTQLRLFLLKIDDLILKLSLLLHMFLSFILNLQSHFVHFLLMLLGLVADPRLKFKNFLLADCLFLSHKLMISLKSC